jgi:hypothetical protein
MIDHSMEESVKRGALTRLNPLRWLRSRREQSVVCSLVCVMEHAIARWVECPAEVMRVTREDYARIKETVRRDHRSKGMEYVGPFCSWRALGRFVESAAAKSGFLCAVPGSEDKVRAKLTRGKDGVLEVRLERAPNEDWSLEGVMSRWARIVAVRRSRRPTE